jgi:hypothetical protein
MAPSKPVSHENVVRVDFGPAQANRAFSSDGGESHANLKVTARYGSGTSGPVKKSETTKYRASGSRQPLKASNANHKSPLVSRDGNGMDEKPYIDARIEAVEARTESAIARLETQLSKLPTASVVRGNVWGATAVLAATVIAMFSLWAMGYDSGIQITSVSVEDAIGARQIADQNAEQIEGLNRKMDTILDLIRERAKE